MYSEVNGDWYIEGSNHILNAGHGENLYHQMIHSFYAFSNRFGRSPQIMESTCDTLLILGKNKVSKLGGAIMKIFIKRDKRRTKINSLGWLLISLTIIFITSAMVIGAWKIYVALCGSSQTLQEHAPTPPPYIRDYVECCIPDVTGTCPSGYKCVKWGIWLTNHGPIIGSAPYPWWCMDEDDASICEQKPSDIPVPREQKR